MKRVNATFSLDLEEIAAQLAHLCSDQQAMFLDAFLDELRHHCGTQYKAESQMFFIRHDISSDTLDLLACFGKEFNN